MDSEFEIDLNQLLLRKIQEAGGTEQDFDRFSKLVSQYAQKCGAPEDGAMLIVIDSFSCGMSKEQIETQLRIYHSKIDPHYLPE